MKTLNSASLCRSGWDENGNEGLQRRLVQEHLHVLQCNNANCAEEAARLDAERWRTESMKN